jgi:serine/threonine protein kinase
MILYYLCVGTTMFHGNVSENIVSMHELTDLASFDETRAECISKLELIEDKVARNLVSLMLKKDPRQRLSASRILTHPFFTGRQTSFGNQYVLYHVFLSYRVATDFRHAQLLYEVLTDAGLSVWLVTLYYLKKNE